MSSHGDHPFYVRASSSNSSSTSSVEDQSPDSSQPHNQVHMDVFRLPFATQDATSVEYPPPIPVAFRYPRLVGSVKQYRSDAQEQQLQHHIVSESFIPMAPDLAKPPRKRRRPPFSYSSLIAQAILEAEDERMTLRDIYRWIMEKYPALYDADDTGWQVSQKKSYLMKSAWFRERWLITFVF